MTISEAVALVIQAAAIGGQGSIYVLDMGEPVKILDLARNMIRLSGREPDVDVSIEVVGARPGDELREVLWADGEAVTATEHPKVLRSTRPPIDAAWLDEELADLGRLVEEGETLELVSRLGSLMRSPRRVPAATRDQAAKKAESSA
jgi:FlaA1/EpsC-like NDP-sugar epimerase